MPSHLTSATVLSVTDDSTRLLTRKEVGELLRLHPRTVSRLVAAGKLPVVRISDRAVRFRPADVQAYIEQGAA